jgi:tagatose 1,6-diphosphate aldolase GatY/KbaY
MLRQARDGKFGIVAFNVHTLEMMQAVVEAAEECEAPVILQTSVGTVRHLGGDYLAAAAQTAAAGARVPIALHLDHCTDIGLILKCMRYGYTSVMIDASMHPFDVNAEMTKRVVEVARALGVNVEAELGRVGGVEDELEVDEAEAFLADPEQCRAFVGLTGVDTLAPAVGTQHGLYRGEPRIDFGRIERIAEAVDVPLVLHGGSGIPDEMLKRCIASGMAKINVATELKNAFTAAIRDYLAAHPDETDPRKYMAPAKEAVKRLAMEKIRLCGSEGRAKAPV